MTTLHRLVAVAVAALITASTALVSAPAAHAADTTDPTLATAGWLATRIGDDGAVTSAFDDGTQLVTFADQGLTADVVLALDAAGVGQDAATRATDFLRGDAQAYISGGNPPDRYAGAIAKLLVVAAAQDVAPGDFGGVDLLEELEARRQQTGRYTDASSFGDFSNGITQSLVVLALTRAGEPADDATAYLASQQCPGGGFRELMADEPCTDDAQAGVDTTSFAVQALLAVADGTTDAAADRAAGWLADQQAADGSFGGDGTFPPNANSTGLAALALSLTGQDEPAGRARTWLIGLQYGCDAPEADRGAVAYSTEDVYASLDDDIERGDVTRATAQVVPGLVGVGLLAATADGAAPDASRLACAPATPSPTPTPSATPTPSPTLTPEPTRSDAGTAVLGQPTTAQAPTSGRAPTLAATGVETVSGPVGALVAAGLLVTGIALASVAGRGRRGGRAP